jgi:hypothetical protein
VSKQRWAATAATLPVILAAGVWTGLSGAGPEAVRATTTGLTEPATSTGLTAQLSALKEVPKPKGVRPGAKGTFTAGLVRSSSGGKLSWRLTFQGLTGKATASHIHLGAPGKAGVVRVALCGPCRSGARGSARIDAKTVKALLAAGTYVNIHTARNPAGEIRGQIRKSAKPPVPAPPPPPPTTTETGSSTGITYSN